MNVQKLKYFFCQSESLSQHKLIFAYQLVRHGHRYCMKGYYLRGHPYYEQQLKFKGHLTHVGMVQQKRLGQLIREEYINQKKLLGDKYEVNEISIYSSNSSRCLQSANSFMQGLYPEESVLIDYHKIQNDLLEPPYFNDNSNDPSKEVQQKIQSRINDLKMYPFPIRNFGIDDHILNPTLPNKKNIIDEQKKQSKQLVLEEILQFEKELKEIKNKIGLQEDFNHLDASSMFDITLSQKYLGISYSLNEFQYNLLNYLKAFQKLHAQYTQYYSRVTISHFLNYLLKIIELKIQQQLTMNMIFGFTHDSRIVPLLLLFDLINLKEQKYGLFNNTNKTFEQYPPYCANFIFELYQKKCTENNLFNDERLRNNKDLYSVGIKYNGKYIKIPNHDSNFMDINKFQSFIQRNTISDQEFNQFTGSNIQIQSFLESFVSNKK